MRLLLALFVGFSACFVHPASSAAPEFGQRLFWGGEDAGVEATLRGANVTTSAVRFPCAGCHGLGAEGGGEGAISAPSLLPGRLLANGKTLTEDSLLVALTQGKGLDSRILDGVMPSYGVNPSQAGQLLAFLKQLEIAETAGLATHYRIGYVSEGKALSQKRLVAEKLDSFVDSLGLRQGLWGKPFSFVDLDDVAMADSDNLLAVIGEASEPGESAEKPRAGPIVFPHLTLVQPDKSGRHVALYASIEKQFQVLLAQLATGKHAACFVIVGSRASDRQRFELWRKIEQKASKLPCVELKKAVAPAGQSAVLLLTVDREALNSLSRQFKPSDTTVYGLLDTLMPAAQLLMQSNFRSILVDPHPALTASAVKRRSTLAIAHIEESLRALSKALKQVGRHATRQEVLNELRRNPSLEEKIGTIELMPF